MVSFRNKLSGLSPEQRLWAQVTKSGPLCPGRGRCWVKLNSKSWYLHVGGRLEVASRFSWVLHNGPIPDGLEVCHHCDNPACIRPSHLFVATHKENMEDMVIKCRGRGGVSGPSNSSTKYPHLRQGDRNGNKKLSSQKVLELRMDYKSGKHTYRSLAIKYNVSTVTVNRIVNNRSWKYTLTRSYNAS